MHAVGRQYRQYNDLIFDLLRRYREQRQYSLPIVFRIREPNKADQDPGSLSATFLECPIRDVVPQQSYNHLALTDMLQSSAGGNTTGKPITQYSSRRKPMAKSDDVLMVPYMCAVTLGSDVIVTYSHLDFDDLCGTNKEISAPSDTPTTVKIEDLERRFHFFDLSTCKNFYSLRSLVVRECRPHLCSTDLLEILFEDGRRVTGENWLISNSRCKTSVISLVLAFNDCDQGSHHANSLPKTRSSTNTSMFPSIHEWSADRNRQQTTTLSSARSTAYPSHATKRDPSQILEQVMSRAVPSDSNSEAQLGNTEAEPEFLKYFLEGERSMADLLGRVPKPFLLRTSSQNILGLNHNLSRLQKNLRYNKLYRKGIERTWKGLRQNTRSLLVKAQSPTPDPIPLVPGKNTTSTSGQNPGYPAECTRQNRFRDRLFRAATLYYLHFLPEDQDHVDSLKYWGALDAISTVSPSVYIRKKS